jgi:hypothetical protein
MLKRSLQPLAMWEKFPLSSKISKSMLTSLRISRMISEGISVSEGGILSSVVRDEDLIIKRELETRPSQEDTESLHSLFDPGT